MAPLSFNAVIGDDRIIHIPLDIDLPTGAWQITLRPAEPSSQQGAGGNGQTSHQWLVSLAKEAEKVTCALPADLAENHDHYVYGKPRP